MWKDGKVVMLLTKMAFENFEKRGYFCLMRSCLIGIFAFNSDQYISASNEYEEVNDMQENYDKKIKMLHVPRWFGHLNNP